MFNFGPSQLDGLVQERRNSSALVFLALTHQADIIQTIP